MPNYFNEYEVARDKIDIFLKESHGRLKPSLDIIATRRGFISGVLMQQWINQTSKVIPNIDRYISIDGLSVKLGQASRKYWEFAFYNRALNDLEKNLSSRKIYSYEIQFYSKYKILEIIGDQDMFLEKDGELSEYQRLFYINPLGHYFYYRFIKDISIRIAPQDGDELIRIAEALKKAYNEFLLLFISFFSKYKQQKIGTDDFRDFIESNEVLMRFFDFIDNNKPIKPDSLPN